MSFSKPEIDPAISRSMFVNMIKNKETPRLQTTGTVFRCENNNVYLLFMNSKESFCLNNVGYTRIAYPLVIVTAATLLSLYEYFAINNNPTVEHLNYEVMVNAAMYTDRIHKLLKDIADDDSLQYRGSEQLYIINRSRHRPSEPSEEVKVACMPYDFVRYDRTLKGKEDDLTTDRLEIIFTEYDREQPSFSPFTVDSNNPAAWNNFRAIKEMLRGIILKSKFFDGMDVLYLAMTLVHPELNDDEKWSLSNKVTTDCLWGA